jgi:hypothetical protein
MIAHSKTHFFGSSPLEFDSGAVKIGGHARNFSRSGSLNNPKPLGQAYTALAPVPVNKVVTQEAARTLGVPQPR